MTNLGARPAASMQGSEADGEMEPATHLSP
jgi:hypothetical protein